MGQAVGLPVHVQWSQLGALHGQDAVVQPAAPIGADIRDFTLPVALGLLNDQLNCIDDRIDTRTIDGRVVVSRRSHFDRLEARSVAFDLAPLAKSAGARIDDIVPRVAMLLATVVEPNQWTENGGSMALCAAYGSKLFVTAPERMHAQIAWVMREAASASFDAAPASEQGQPLEVRPVLTLAPRSGGRTGLTSSIGGASGQAVVTSSKTGAR